MDLNINGRSAIICASSKGRGKACALALARDNVTINNLLPGYVATDRMWSVVEAGAKAAGKDPETFGETMFSSIGAKRPGEPDEFGAVCAFLCSQQAPSSPVTGDMCEKRFALSRTKLVCFTQLW
jgi:NAD(P)-dependent dehydrogenase (short-subunit alcohol dehydrogenase family)